LPIHFFDLFTLGEWNGMVTQFNHHESRQDKRIARLQATLHNLHHMQAQSKTMRPPARGHFIEDDFLSSGNTDAPPQALPDEEIAHRLGSIFGIPIEG
jgi:hypothetical protein